MTTLEQKSKKEKSKDNWNAKKANVRRKTAKIAKTTEKKQNVGVMSIYI